MTTLQVIHFSALGGLSVAICLGLRNAKDNVPLRAIGFGLVLVVLGLVLSLRQTGPLIRTIFLDSDSAYARTYVIGLSFALGGVLRLAYSKIRRAKFTPRR